MYSHVCHTHLYNCSVPSCYSSTDTLNDCYRELTSCTALANSNLVGVSLSLRCRRSSLRCLNNASLFILLLFVQLSLSRPSSNLGKFWCHMFCMTLTIQRPYMALQENFVACYPWHDDPTTVYGRSGVLQKTFCYTKTCKVLCSFLSFKLVKWRSNETLALVWGLLRFAPVITLFITGLFARFYSSLNIWRL